MRNEPTTTQEPSNTDNRGAAARRARTLELLHRQSSRTSEGELAARIAADAPGANAGASDDEVRDLHVVLRHVDLPKIAAAGLVSWDESTGTVEPAEDPTLCETEARQLFADGWDDAAAVSRYEQRRAALDVLREVDGEVSVDDLAAEVAAHETDDDVAPSASDVDDVGTALYHRHLPKLQDANLIEYDPVGGTVSYTGPPGPARRSRACPSDRSGGSRGAGREDERER